MEIANKLAHQVLGRSLDELPPQTRRLLMLLDGYVTAACEKQKRDRRDFRFTRRQVREATGWGNTQVKVHLARLEELEYVLARRSADGATFLYELVYDGQGKDGTPFLAGLADPAQLHAYDASRSGVNEGKSAPGRPQVGGVSGGGRGGEIDDSPSEAASFGGSEPNPAGKALPGASPEPEPCIAVAASPRPRARAS